MGGGSAAAAAPRASFAERERVAARLREACAEERLSLESFVARIDYVFSARTRSELDELVADLPEPGRVGRALLAAIGSVSRWTYRLEDAWRTPRLPRLTLPAEELVTLGRSRTCRCVIAGENVSRRHAVLRREGERWCVADARSRNGTYVNGRRVASTAEVRPGDVLTLGDVSFVLRAPGP